MPVYDYKCRDCGHTFIVVESLQDHEHAHPICPACHGEKVERVISGVHVQTGRKS